MIDRRAFLIASSAALAASAVYAPYIARAAVPFEQPKLPYPEDALSPTISAQTVSLHYGKHHKDYFTKLNELAPGTAYADIDLEQIVRQSASKSGEKDKKISNNASQAWNHVAYWEQMKPGGPKSPRGRLAEAIDKDFGGLQGFKDKIASASEDVFGTGWVWVTLEGGRIVIAGLQDGGNPLASGRPALLGIDVWEHAYYLDYENRRKEHVKAVLDNLVNWSVVESRMA